MEGHLSWVIAIYRRNFFVSLSRCLDIDFFPLRGHVANSFHKAFDRNVAGKSAVSPQNSSIYDMAQLQTISNALSVDKSHPVIRSALIKNQALCGNLREFLIQEALLNALPADPKDLVQRLSARWDS